MKPAHVPVLELLCRKERTRICPSWCAGPINSCQESYTIKLLLEKGVAAATDTYVRHKYVRFYRCFTRESVILRVPTSAFTYKNQYVVGLICLCRWIENLPTLPPLQSGCPAPQHFLTAYIQPVPLSSSQHLWSRNPPVCCRTPWYVRTALSGYSPTITGYDCGQRSFRQHGCRAYCAERPGANDSVWCRKICCIASRRLPQYWWDETLAGYVLCRTAAHCPCREHNA